MQTILSTQHSTPPPGGPPFSTFHILKQPVWCHHKQQCCEYCNSCPEVCLMCKTDTKSLSINSLIPYGKKVDRCHCKGVFDWVTDASRRKCITATGISVGLGFPCVLFLFFLFFLGWVGGIYIMLYIYTPTHQHTHNQPYISKPASATLPKTP